MSPSPLFFSRAFRCSAILRYAQPKPGDVVVDPVCGSGATLFTPALPMDVSLFAAFACDIDGGKDGDIFKALANYNENRNVRGGVVRDVSFPR
jgi:23S rRNA G2445 N2-methylase RlmL